MRALRLQMYRAVRSDSTSPPSGNSICSNSSVSTKSTIARSRTPSNASEIDKENNSRRHSLSSRKRSNSKGSSKSTKFAEMRSRGGTTTLSTNSHFTVDESDSQTARERSHTPSGIAELKIEDEGVKTKDPMTSETFENSVNETVGSPIDEPELLTETPEPDELEQEFFLCNIDEMQENGMREFTVENTPIILIKSKNGFYALPSICPFCSSSLEEGLLTPTHIRCAPHGSAYNLETGELEDGPGFSSLHSYKTKIDNDQIFIRTPLWKLKEKTRIVKMAKCTNFVDDPTVIVGSGPSSLTCAETLRKKGYTNQIIIITKDDVLTYDRKKLSKRMKHDINEYIFRQEWFFEKYGIKVWLRTTVTNIDVEKRIVYCSDGKPITYSNLVLATGSTNKTFKAPGSNMDGIHYLRDYHDAETLYSQIRRKHVTIIGMGFEGLEICSTIDDIASSVTLLGRSSYPLRYFGPHLGKEISQLLFDNGINVRYNSQVRSFDGYDRVSHLILKDGMHIIANTVIVSRGARPITSFLEDTPIKLAKSGHIIVDENCRTNQPNIYAIGDATEFPLTFLGEERREKMPFWQLAQEQGKIAAFSIMGKQPIRKIVPFIWIDLFKKHITFCGDPTIKPDEIIMRGKLKTNNYVSYFFKDERVTGVINCGPQNVTVQFLELFQRGIKISYADVQKNENNDWRSYFL